MLVLFDNGTPRGLARSLPDILWRRRDRGVGKVQEPFIDALANIAVIDPGIISVSREGYESWLRQRAERLAEVANEFLFELSTPR